MIVHILHKFKVRGTFAKSGGLLRKSPPDTPENELCQVLESLYHTNIFVFYGVRRRAAGADSGGGRSTDRTDRLDHAPQALCGAVAVRVVHFGLDLVCAGGLESYHCGTAAGTVLDTLPV